MYSLPPSLLVNITICVLDTCPQMHPEQKHIGRHFANICQIALERDHFRTRGLAAAAALGHCSQPLVGEWAPGGRAVPNVTILATSQCPASNPPPPSPPRTQTSPPAPPSPPYPWYFSDLSISYLLSSPVLLLSVKMLFPLNSHPTKHWQSHHQPAWRFLSNTGPKLPIITITTPNSTTTTPSNTIDLQVSRWCYDVNPI